ncbi:MAG: hypothetical protein KJ955_03070 [Nanoarchaeota archaeon]|nr:hypothetical protein [Nanoarchaeota archaeon]
MTLLTRIRKTSNLCNKAIQLREFRAYTAQIEGRLYHTFTPFQAAVLQELGASLEFYETDKPYYNTCPATELKLRQINGIGSVDKEKARQLADVLTEDLSGDYPKNHKN